MAEKTLWDRYVELRNEGYTEEALVSELKAQGFSSVDFDLPLSTAKTKAAERLKTRAVSTPESVTPTVAPATPPAAPVPETQSPLRKFEMFGVPVVGVQETAKPKPEPVLRNYIESPGGLPIVRKPEEVEPIPGKPMMRGGLLRNPAEAVEQVVGLAKGAAKGVAQSWQDPDASRQIQDSIIEAAVRSRKKELKENDFVTRLGNDAAKTFIGALEIFSAAVQGVPMESDADVMKKAEEMGINVPPALAGSVRAIVNDPTGDWKSGILETASAAPLTTALTVWPMVGSAGKLAKAGGAAVLPRQTAAVTSFMAKATPKVANGLVSAFGVVAPYKAEWLKRFLVDSLISNNPTATALMDDIVEATAKIEGGFDVAKQKMSMMGDTVNVEKATAGLDTTVQDLLDKHNIPKKVQPTSKSYVAPPEKPVSWVTQSTIDEMSAKLPTKAPELPVKPTATIADKVIAGTDTSNPWWLLDKSFRPQLDAVVKEVNIARRLAGKQANVGLNSAQLAKMIANGDDILTKFPEFTAAYEDVLLNTIGKSNNVKKITDINRNVQLQKLQNDLLQQTTQKALEDSFYVTAGDKSRALTKMTDPYQRVGYIVNQLISEKRPPFIPVTEKEMEAVKNVLTGKVQYANTSGFDPKRAKPALDYVERMQPIQVGKTVGYAEPAVAAQVAPLSLQSSMENILGKDLADIVRFTTVAVPKAVVLPFNFKAGINNLVSNATFMPIVYGTRFPLLGEIIDIGNMLLRKTKEGITGKLDPIIEVARRNSLFDTNMIQKDIDFMTKPGAQLGKIEADKLKIGGVKTPLTEGTDIDTLRKGLKTSANVMSMPSKVGDEMSKVFIFKNEYPFAMKMLDNTDVGHSTILRVSPTASSKLTKVEGGWQLQKFVDGRGVGRIVNVPDGSTLIEDVAARYAKNVADNMLFDYGRVPGLLNMVRQAPIIGAGSPFFTWSWKALDLPFVKPGLFAHISNPRGIVSSSPTVNLLLAKDGIGIASRRGAVMSAQRHAADMVEQDPEIRRALSANPQAPGSYLTRIYKNNDPSMVLVQKFASDSPMSGLVDAMYVGKKMLDTITGDEDVYAKAKKEAGKNALKGGEFSFDELNDYGEKVRKATMHDRDVVPIVAKMFGAAGSMLLDTYNEALDAEAMGKSVDWSDIAYKLFTPAPVKATFDRLSTPEMSGMELGKSTLLYDNIFKQNPEGVEPFETINEAYIRNLLGFGWRAIDSAKQRDRFKNAIKAEAESRFGQKALKQQIDLFNKRLEAMPDEANAYMLGNMTFRLESIYANINDIINNALEETGKLEREETVLEDKLGL